MIVVPKKEVVWECLLTIDISVPNVPQSTVLGHCLGAGFVSGSQIDGSQVTAPGVWVSARFRVRVRVSALGSGLGSVLVLGF